MKKILIILTLFMSTLIYGEVGMGIKLGTLNEISIIKDEVQFGLGVSMKLDGGLSYTMDRIYPYDNYYYGIGIAANTFNGFDFGIRGLMGFSAREQNLEFFAELAPTYYMKELITLEAGLGIRIHF